MDELLLLMEGINKAFPGVQALNQARFDLYPGEVHALVGENGAGKSTLMKILAGVYSKDAGRIVYRGKEVEIPNPRAAQDRGISMIHQELNLIPHLTVAQNVFIGREPRRGLSFLLDDDKINAQTQALFESMHLRLDPRVKVVVGKWLTANTDILIFDEPTRGIDVGAKSEIYHLLNELARQGKSIIMISSELPEILRMSHRIIIMCEGRITGELTAAEATQERIMTYVT
mgnify:CR=1 FL=1